jgi:hypothetical protein
LPGEVGGNEAGPGDRAQCFEETGITHTLVDDGPDEILGLAHDLAILH